ncbi:uncharacterized protein LOC109860277 [Pseudomyrmex gracilis]|uniref:uncharacterized protein LOC109860277 n=1 Tax=Pseudomyrmex gracilis TaxID=219809 RepID=UPI000995C4C6|nr:uncharacterized protein LOC109860277 [Pseudomyrmex gracilis]
MRLEFILLLLTISLSWSTARVRERVNDASSSTVRSIDEPDCAPSGKSLDNGKNIKRMQIFNQTGFDGKVHRIRIDSSEEDKPGIHAYGLPKKRFRDNGVIERIGENRIDNVPKSGRLVEAYGMPKNIVESNGFVERVLSSNADRYQLGTTSRNDNENVRIRRSVQTGTENKIEEKVASETEDMEAQDAKVFRPLFVYRQQVAARQRRKHARNVAHKNHVSQPCNYKSAIY